MLDDMKLRRKSEDTNIYWSFAVLTLSSYLTDHCSGAPQRSSDLSGRSLLCVIPKPMSITFSYCLHVSDWHEAAQVSCGSLFYMAPSHSDTPLPYLLRLFFYPVIEKCSHYAQAKFHTFSLNRKKKKKEKIGPGFCHSVFSSWFYPLAYWFDAIFYMNIKSTL